ncbi:MAG: hypothetical protein ACPGJI_06955 [Kangiellaceae bacterium]
MKLTKNSSQGSLSQIFMVSLISVTLMFGSGCGGLSSKRLKQIGAVVVLGVAAKLIYDMVVEYQSKQVNDEDEVVKKYKLAHGELPAEPQLVTYESSIQPGDVVTVGKDISIQSKLEVVRSAKTRNLIIEEKITIFDNEDNQKELKSYVKTVNAESNASGAFENEFTFQLPKGMPQGIYPVRTEVLVDGKAFAPVNSQMQLVDIRKVESLELNASL